LPSIKNLDAFCDLHQLLEPKSYQKKHHVIHFTILVYGDRKGTQVTFSDSLWLQKWSPSSTPLLANYIFLVIIIAHWDLTETFEIIKLFFLVQSVLFLVLQV